MATRKIEIADVEPLIDETKGNIATIAKRLGVNRSTVWARINESATLRAALQDAREAMLDNAESKLYSNVLNGDTTSLIFFLKTQGRSRGYQERIDLDIRDKRQRAETAVEEYMRQTGKNRQAAIEALKPHIPQISELVH